MIDPVALRAAIEGYSCHAFRLFTCTFRRACEGDAEIGRPPVTPDYGNCQSMDYWSCGTSWIWRVVGPEDFLRELRIVEGAPSPFPDALPCSERYAERGVSLYRCHYEVRAY